MRHAEHNLAHAQIAAALDDLLQRRHNRFTAVKPEPLGAGIFHIEKFLQAFGFGKFLENRPLALMGENNFLVRPFDTLLQPRLFLRVGNMHELDCQRAAIGTAQNLNHFANGCGFQPQHIVDEDGSVEIFFREAVRGGVKFRMRCGWLQTQRIQISRQMAAKTIGADHHNGTHTVQRGRANRLFVGTRHACCNLVAQLCLIGCVGGPVSVQHSRHFTIDNRRPVGALPRRSLRHHIGGATFCAIFQTRKIVAPASAQRGVVVFVAGILLFEVMRVGTVKMPG